MLYSDILKAAIKHLKKIPTGNPKRPWRYIYRDDKKKSRNAPRVVESDSPLAYGSPNVKRLTIEDPSAPAERDEGPKSGAYFSAGSPAVAFVDYSLYDGGDRVYIHYASTRSDQRGAGAARLLIDDLYERFKDKAEINWGKIMSDNMETLFRDKRSAGSVPTYGKVW